MENRYQQDDFDRQFRADLKKAGQGAKPDPQDWDQLLTRLQHKRRKRRVLPVWLPWLLLGAALGWNGFTSIQLYRLENRLSEIPVATPTVNNNISRSSTIIYDTIYRTVILTVKKPEFNPAYIQTSAQTTDFSAVPALHSGTNHSISSVTAPPPVQENAVSAGATTPAGQLLADTSLVAQTRLAAAVSTEKTTDVPAPPPADTLHLPPVAKPDQPQSIINEVFTPANIKKEKKTYHYQLEGGFALALPLHTRNVSYNGLAGGRLACVLELNKHWQLNAAVFAGNAAFKNETNFEERLLLPAPESPSQDLKFKYVEGNIRQFIPSLGIQYTTARPKKWNWNVGLSYAALIWSPDGLEYEFFDQQSGAEYNYETDGVAKAYWLNLEFAAGANYQIRPRWALFSRLGAVRNLQPDAPALFQGTLGIRYRLH